MRSLLVPVGTEKKLITIIWIQVLFTFVLDKEKSRRLSRCLSAATCKTLFQEIRKSRILLGKAGIIKEDEEDKEEVGRIDVWLLSHCYHSPNASPVLSPFPITVHRFKCFLQIHPSCTFQVKLMLSSNT